MAKNGGTCLYREARLNIEPAFPGSTIAFTLPASATSTFSLRTQAKRAVITDQDTEQDDDAFAKRHLASDGSMFFRKHHEYPRSFLWRILDGRKVLEIQSADLDHDFAHSFEANLTLLLQFASPIRPYCVAFAESPDRDSLTVYAITAANELYAITLHRDFFVHEAASERDVEDWCKRYGNIALFANRIPYRLIAVSVDELLVALDDGGILRLTWNKDDSSWTEAVYQQSSWSVRGFLSWKGPPKVRFDNAELFASAAVSLAKSPDEQHILSVCLDHTLRAWNVESGKPGIHIDILGDTETTNDKSNSFLIGPSQSTLMAVVNIPGGIGGALYHVVTYSPKQHQFKFWGIRDADDNERGIYDIRDEVEFVPPVDELMNTTVWTMEEFHVVPGVAGWRGTELWIRARSGPSSRVYSLRFDLNDEPEDLTKTWKNDWVSVDSGALTVEALKKNPSNPTDHDLDISEYGPDLPEQWIDFLFSPRRFTIATLETALHIYKKGLDRTQAVRLSSRASLKERIYKIVTTFAGKSQNGTIDVEQFEDAVASQWQTFYGLVKDLHKRRGESLCLVYDYGLDMPWLVLSDHLSAIRKCSDVEISTLNAATFSASQQLTGPLRKALDKPESREVSRLLNAAASFRRRLPLSVQHEVRRQIETDLLQSRPLTLLDRMELIEQNSDLSAQVSDDDVAFLVEEIGSDIKYLTTETFLRAIQTLGHVDQGRANRRKQIARYGLNALVSISKETLETDYDTLLDLLVLILFMEFEGDNSEDFDASEVFVELVDQFKDFMTVSWLGNTVWSHQTSTGPASEALMRTLDENLKTSSRFPFTQTVLAGIYGHRAFALPLSRGLKSDLLTYWSRGWIAYVFKEQNYDSVVEDIMGILLFQKEFDLALEFSKFLPEGNWTTYLKGRLHIALGENSLASVCFQKNAYNLGKYRPPLAMDQADEEALGIFNVEDADTAGLVSEADRTYFSEGMARYYAHVLGLFEKAKAYTYVADFARLGLRSLKGHEDDELKTELLQRLFTASIQTSRFADAYSAMIRHNDEALKHSSLQTLVTSMIQQSQTTALLKFPFVGLADDVDAILSSLCQKTLNLSSGPPYHQILYSYRISRNDFRGAASILYDRLERLKTTSSRVHDPADESLSQCYLMIINTLSSVRKEDAYILAEQRIENSGAPQWGIGKAKKMLKRQIITLDTLRKDYQAELDRVAAIEAGHFPFVEAGDEMEIL